MIYLKEAATLERTDGKAATGRPFSTILSTTAARAADESYEFYETPTRSL